MIIICIIYTGYYMWLIYTLIWFVNITFISFLFFAFCLILYTVLYFISQYYVTLIFLSTLHFISNDLLLYKYKVKTRQILRVQKYKKYKKITLQKKSSSHVLYWSVLTLQLRASWISFYTLEPHRSHYKMAEVDFNRLKGKEWR
jgi:hypothetical protein